MAAIQDDWRHFEISTFEQYLSNADYRRITAFDEIVISKKT